MIDVGDHGTVDGERWVLKEAECEVAGQVGTKIGTVLALHKVSPCIFIIYFDVFE